VFSFGAGAAVDDARALVVPLRPLGEAPVEVWQVPGDVVHGRDGPVRWSTDGALLFGAIEVDEAAAGGVVVAAEQAYAALHDSLARHGCAYPLRIWNYLDAITEGEGDLERYRQFCVGRARGLGSFDVARLPAATAIGSRDGRRVLQVYWLAAREPGLPLENPRQVAAYRYPRQYGPQPPSFARAMLPPAGGAMPLLLSGTASVVGHETRHADSLPAQLDETFANFDSLLDEAHRRRPEVPPRFGPGSRLKVYLRDPAGRAAVDAALARLAPGVPALVLQADICRRDLQVEIDGVHC
jgi:chorismate lyase/3-hydroxybenzoate synthase